MRTIMIAVALLWFILSAVFFFTGHYLYLVGATLLVGLLEGFLWMSEGEFNWKTLLGLAGVALLLFLALRWLFGGAKINKDNIRALYLPGSRKLTDFDVPAARNIDLSRLRKL